MKKITIVFVMIISLLLLNNKTNAQAFQKGNANLDVGLGLGAYATTTTFSVNIPFLGNITSVTTDGASSVMVPIGFEYGVSDKIGLGAQLGFSNYFIDDSTEVKDFFTGQETGEMQANTTESVSTIDFSIKVNFHLLNSDKNDLLIGFQLGGSRVNWKDLSGETLTGTGSLFSLYLTDRIFFSDHIGVLFNLGYTAYNYGNVTSSSNNAVINSLTWKLRGLNIGTGLAIKF